MRTLRVQSVLRDMPLLDSFVMECLRVRPPVGTLMRQLDVPTRVLGHELPPLHGHGLALCAVPYDRRRNCMRPAPSFLPTV